MSCILFPVKKTLVPVLAGEKLAAHTCDTKCTFFGLKCCSIVTGFLSFSSFPIPVLMPYKLNIFCEIFCRKCLMIRMMMS